MRPECASPGRPLLPAPRVRQSSTLRVFRLEFVFPEPILSRYWVRWPNEGALDGNQWDGGSCRFSFVSRLILSPELPRPREKGVQTRENTGFRGRPLGRCHSFRPNLQAQWRLRLLWKSTSCLRCGNGASQCTQPQRRLRSSSRLRSRRSGLCAYSYPLACELASPKDIQHADLKRSQRLSCPALVRRGNSGTFRTRQQTTALPPPGRASRESPGVCAKSFNNGPRCCSARQNESLDKDKCGLHVGSSSRVSERYTCSTPFAMSRMGAVMLTLPDRERQSRARC
jgi:hypothetical protein